VLSFPQNGFSSVGATEKEREEGNRLSEIWDESFFEIPSQRTGSTSSSLKESSTFVDSPEKSARPANFQLSKLAKRALKLYDSYSGGDGSGSAGGRGAEAREQFDCFSLSLFHWSLLPPLVLPGNPRRRQRMFSSSLAAAGSHLLLTSSASTWTCRKKVQVKKWVKFNKRWRDTQRPCKNPCPLFVIAVAAAPGGAAATGRGLRRGKLYLLL
jgi:hypothetical protein